MASTKAIIGKNNEYNIGNINNLNSSQNNISKTDTTVHASQSHIDYEQHIQNLENELKTLRKSKITQSKKDVSSKPILVEDCFSKSSGSFQIKIA